MFFIPTAFAQRVASDEAAGGLTSALGNFFTAIPLWIAAGIVFFLSLIAASALKRIVSYRVAQRAQHELHQEVIILIERTTWFTVVMFGLIIAFGIVGINIATLIGFLGLGLGFALKDLLANFIAGVVILTQKKFHIGDIIRVHGISGKIIEIETRTTQIKAFDGTVHIIPNAGLLTSAIQNFSVNSFRRVAFQVGVHYDTPLKEAVELTLRSIKSHPKVVPDPKPRVLVKGFGDSAILLEVRFWVESTTFWLRVRSEIMQKLKRDYDAAGITIPYPMRALTLDSHDKNILEASHVTYQKPAYNFPAKEAPHKASTEISVPPVPKSEEK